jgi:hypothetical protein
MVIPIGIIFALLPETPWWLASKGELEKAAQVLRLCNGSVEGYDIEEHIVRVSPTLTLKPCFPMLEASTNPITGNYGGHRQSRTDDCRSKQGGWSVVYLPRPEPPPIPHRWVAQDHPAVCWLDRIQYIRRLLL